MNSGYVTQSAELQRLADRYGHKVERWSAAEKRDAAAALLRSEMTAKNPAFWCDTLIDELSKALCWHANSPETIRRLADLIERNDAEAVGRWLIDTYAEGAADWVQRVIDGDAP
ncbi:MAG: hypothetical protein AB7P99_21290 [Vicinamibacterales bacterium]